jgi:hypothetical protein
LKEENQKEKPPFNHQNNLYQKWINERFDFEKCFNSFKDNIRYYERSCISDCLYFSQVETYNCTKCGKFYNFSLLPMVQIDLNNFSQEGAPKYDLKNYINTKFNNQFDIICKGCQSQASVQYKIINISQILIIHIYRRDPTSSHKTEINLDIKLDITNCILHNDKIFPNKEFCLKGYIGYDEKNGYFFDYNYKSCKDNLKWIRYSNNKYTYINSDFLNNCKPILVFYEAIDDKKKKEVKPINNTIQNTNLNSQMQNSPFIQNNGRNMPIQNSSFGNANNNSMNNNMNNNMINNNMLNNNMNNNNMNNNMFNNNMLNNNINNNTNQMSNNMFNNPNNMINNNMNQQFSNNFLNNAMMPGLMNPMMMNAFNNQGIYQMQQNMFQQISKQQLENQQQNRIKVCNEILDSMEKKAQNPNIKNPNNEEDNIKLNFQLIDEKKLNKIESETIMYMKKTEKMNEIFEKYLTKLQSKKEDNLIKKLIYKDNEISTTSTQTVEELNIKNDSKIKAIKNK